MFWLFAVGIAAEPVQDFDYEITVYGKEAERQARWDVIIALKRLGWEPIDTSSSRTVFKPPRRWLGRAVLDADGTLDFRYRGLALKKVNLSEPVATDANPAFANEPGMMLTDYGEGEKRTNTLPAGEAGLWLLPSRALVDRVVAKTREATRSELEQYTRIQRDTRVRAEIAAVPERLDALWEDGTPLEGAAPIESLAQRKSHVLAYWASRSDTFEGRQVTRAVEIWIGNTLQDSETPVTEEERRQAESKRSDGRALTL